MRLIDADKITESNELAKKIEIMNLTPYINVDDLLEFVDKLPTIEAVPVVEAEWIEVGVTCGITILKCSNCGKEHPRLHENFCRDCGAKMKGGE